MTYTAMLASVLLASQLLGACTPASTDANSSREDSIAQTTERLEARMNATDVTSEHAPRPEKGYEVFGVQVKYDGDPAEYEDFGFICLPDNYDPEGTPTPLIVLCQGTDERTQADTDPRTFNGISYFVAKGYAVMDMNGAAFGWTKKHGFPVDGHHFAHKGLLQSYVKGYEYVQQKYNLQPEAYVMGISMGGGSSFMIVQHQAIPVKAQVAFCPAFSLLKHVYLQPWIGAEQQRTVAGQWGLPNWKTTTPSMAYMLKHKDLWMEWDNLFYGMQGDEKDIQQALTNNRNALEAQAISRLSKSYPCPLSIYHCENDKLVDIRYSRYMQEMIVRGGGKAVITTFPTGGHGGGWLHGKVQDTDIHGKPIQTSECFKGALQFIESIQ